MLLRLITAAIGVPLTGLMLWIGSPILSIGIAIVAGLGTIEVCRITQKRGRRPIPIVAAIWAISFVAIGHSFVEIEPLHRIKFLVVVALTAYLAWQTRQAMGRVALSHWVDTFVTSLYPGIFLAIVPALRSIDKGFEWMVVLIAVCFAADSGSYIGGQFIGKTPFFRSISPNKTVEGAATGLILAIATCSFLVITLDLSDSLMFGILLGFTMGIFCHFGDLVESKLKRWGGVKDSGNVLPGHGGILDRIDSIVFNLMLVYPVALWSIQ